MVLKTYLTNSFSNGINLSKLNNEIKNSNYVSEFDGLNKTETEVEVLGSSIVNNSGLDSIIFSHISQSLTVKIYDYIDIKGDISIPPVNIDFITGLNVKLHRKSILVKGECIREEYYSSFDGVTYSNLIVKEESVYIRDLLGFPINKIATVYWTRSDGTFHPITKTWTKYYSNLEKIDEGKVRRGNLVDNIQMPCIGLISIAMIGTPNATGAVILEGRRFLADYKIEFDNFQSSSDKTILACLSDINHAKYISSANYSWIDSMTPYGMTIRQYLVNELTI